MRLEDFLKVNHISYKRFAEIIKSSAFTIHGIIHKLRLPTLKLAMEIEKKTMGAVTLYDWFDVDIGENKNDSKKNNKRKNKKK